MEKKIFFIDQSELAETLPHAERAAKDARHKRNEKFLFFFVQAHCAT